MKAIEKYKKIPEGVKASLWFVVCGVVQKGISFLTTPIFSRLLSTSEYGVVSVFTTWHNIIIIFASLNLASGVFLRGLIKYDDDKDEFIASVQSLFVIVFSITFLLYIIFASKWNLLFELSTGYMCLMFADILVQVAFHFWSARQRVQYKYKMLIFFTLLNALLRPGLGVIAINLMSDKVFARISTMVLADIISFGYFFVDFYWRKKIIFSVKYWKYALTYNLPLVPHYLSQFILSQSDRLMIKKMVDDSATGIYSLAYSCAVVLTIVNGAINNSYNPWMYQKIKNGEYNKIGKVSYGALAIVGFLNLFLIICAPEILKIMAPASYSGAIWVIPPIAMGTFFMFLYGLFSNVEFYYEKTQYMMIASVLGAGLNIVLNYIFIRIYGYLAAGYTTLVCYVCFSFVHCLLMMNILKKEAPGVKIYDLRIILGISFGFVILGFGFMFLYNYPIIRYAVMLIIVIVVFIKRKAIYHTCKRILSLKKNEVSS